jgi:hypothetical protein
MMLSKPPFPHFGQSQLLSPESGPMALVHRVTQSTRNMGVSSLTLINREQTGQQPF